MTIINEKGKKILIYATTKYMNLDETKPREMNHSQKDTYLIISLI